MRSSPTWWRRLPPPMLREDARMTSGRCDVLVVGGGMAGLAAAISAARGGAATRLIERYGFLGGMATAAMVGTICGLYETGPADAPSLLNEGFARDVVDRLVKTGARPLRQGRVAVLPYNPFELAALADALCAAEPKLTVSLHTTCVGATTDGGQVSRVRLASWRGAEHLAPRVVIDTSGDAIVALYAGAAVETVVAPARQLWSLVFVLQGVDQGAVGGVRSVAVLRALRSAEAAGELPSGCAAASFRASGRAGEVLVKLALDHLGGDTDDDLTNAEQVGRRRVAALAALLRHNVAGFAASYVSHVAPQVGVRESRRIIGRATLTRDDVLTGRRRQDAIARAAWPIELWEPGGDGARYEYLADGEWYEVPRGCIESADYTNLLAAGRCMSATHEAMGSARVIGTCLAVGEAAGRIAATRIAT